MEALREGVLVLGESAEVVGQLRPRRLPATHAKPPDPQSLMLGSSLLLFACPNDYRRLVLDCKEFHAGS